MNGAIAQCLYLAEQIIRTLDDGAVFQKYETLKNRLISTQPSTHDLSKHIKKLSLENRRLTTQAEELRASLESNDNLSDFMFQKLEQLRAFVIPKAKIPRVHDFYESCISLPQIIDTKERTHRMFRERITEENTQLRLKKTNLQLMEQKELKNLQESLRDKQQAYDNWLSQAKAKIEELQSDITDLEEEQKTLDEQNEILGNKLKEKVMSCKNAARSLKHAERKLQEAVDRQQSLKIAASKSTTELQKILEAIDQRKAVQRFGVQNPDREELMKIQELESTVDILLQQRTKLVAKLKRQKATFR